MSKEIRGSREESEESLSVNSDEKLTNFEVASELSADENDSPWIHWFISYKENDFFCAVDEEFIEDEFNLIGLSKIVPYYDYALDIILDIKIPQGSLILEFTFSFNYIFYHMIKK